MGVWFIIRNSLCMLLCRVEFCKYTKCFLYSVLAKLHPAEKHTERVSNYKPYIEELKTDGITMPMRLQQIPKFEKMNNLSINVYMTDRSGDDKWPVYISKRNKWESFILACKIFEAPLFHK